ncbi:MAG: hypothetical protein KJO69_05440 [Gammaproteobacteria bacterium]|nr:hypothetical protein [Gammaproteobacteria bacterium]
MSAGYRPTKTKAVGSKYGLQTNGKDYLCPECGGYGQLYGVKTCKYCKGKGVIALDDPRVK